MKALFLVALIIACASALVQVPSAVFGIYQYSSMNCTDYCIESLNVTQNGTGVSIAATNLNTSGCSNGATFLFESIGVQISDNMSPSVVNFNVTIDVEDQLSDYEATFDNVGDETTLTIWSTNTPPCATIFTKSAYLMKATIGAIIVAAAVMLI